MAWMHFKLELNAITAIYPLWHNRPLLITDQWVSCVCVVFAEGDYINLPFMTLFAITHFRPAVREWTTPTWELCWHPCAASGFSSKFSSWDSFSSSLVCLLSRSTWSQGVTIPARLAMIIDNWSSRSNWNDLESLVLSYPAPSWITWLKSY